MTLISTKSSNALGKSKIASSSSGTNAVLLLESGVVALDVDVEDDADGRGMLLLSAVLGSMWLVDCIAGLNASTTSGCLRDANVFPLLN